MDHPSDKKRVLTIDDHPTSTRMVRLTLEKTAGVQVRELNSPARALEVAGEFKPDLILLDVDMPGVNGTAVWRMFRATAQHRHTPIIFLTGSITAEEAAAHPLSSPRNHTSVLAKPVSVSQLTERILSVLAGGSAASQRPSPEPASLADR